jgi:hypothetical protein
MAKLASLPNIKAIAEEARTLVDTQDQVLSIMDHCELVDGYDLVDLGLAIEGKYL